MPGRERDAMRRDTPGPLGRDTGAAAQRLQVALWRRMTPLDKARAVSDASRGVRELALAGIRLRHPSGSERECLLRYALRTLDRSLACRAYPDAAAIASR